MNKVVKCILFLNLMFFILLATLNAKVPQLINYQGKVTENGTPVNGYHSILFKIYDSAVNGTLIWQSEVETVYITNGIFSAYIGKTTDVTSPTAFSNIDWGSGDKYIEITLDTTIMQPREKLTSVAYAFFAKDIEDNSVTSNKIVNKSISKSDLSDSIVNYLVPAGVIVMWSGSIANIPDGWALCDGSNGTPDLRDRFIVGAGNSYSVGSIGGSTTHTHGAGTYRVTGTTAGNIDIKCQDEGGSCSHTSPSDNHSHNVDIPVTGTSAAASSLPPYYALAYIMKLPK